MRRKPIGWTNEQKKLAIIACRDAGISDEHRKMLLRHLGAAALINGNPSSTSPRLTNGDFEKFMYLVEGCTPEERLLNYPAGHWQAKFAEGTYSRLMHRALQMSHTLQDAGIKPGGAIAQAIGREYETMQHLDESELHKAINAMRALADRGTASERGAA